MEKINLPKKYEKIWKKCLPLLVNGRPGDDAHAEEVVNFILNYKGKLKIDRDILIPVAMMHDIGHAAILPDHFRYITGPEKIENGKLVHMLAGAKIAQGILQSVKYNKNATREIVDIISMHDTDQLKVADWKKAYTTTNKKIFHDIDALDRYNERRMRDAALMYPNRNKFLKLLGSFMQQFFYEEFKNIAKNNLKKLKVGKK